MSTYQHDNAGAVLRRERDKRIIDMLSSHSILEVAEMTGLTAGRISQIKKAAGLPPRWGNGKKNGKRPPPEPEMVIPPVVAEIINRPQPPKACKLPPARAVGFAGYPGVRVECATQGCRFVPVWQAVGASMVCPLCAGTLQITCTPRNVGE
jgi:hypothetical protein